MNCFGTPLTGKNRKAISPASGGAPLIEISFTRSSFGGALPVVQTQVLWSFSLDPWPKISSVGPDVSVNVVRAAGKGLLLQSIGSVGGAAWSTVRFPSISKLPTVLLLTVLPASVARLVTAAPISTSSGTTVIM